MADQIMHSAWYVEGTNEYAHYFTRNGNLYVAVLLPDRECPEKYLEMAAYALGKANA